MKNVIVLTGGIAGSSVLTALLNKAGYWVGEKTKRKHDYNTWENTELVELNIKLLEEIGFTENWTMRFSPDFITRVYQDAQKIDPAPYRAFVEKCSTNAPWVWKDPRLWLTIRYWKQFLDFKNTCFIVIKRDGLQTWASTILRRQIQTLAYSNRYNDGIHQSILDFLDESNANYIDILYEDLLVTPDNIISEINSLIGSELTVSDLKSVFNGRLYRRQHGFRSLAKATSIFVKNYHVRYR